MKCPNCQTELPDGMQFCGVCGASLQIKNTCPQCGYDNPPDFKFCGKCGKPLATESASRPPIPPAPQPTSFVNNRYQVKEFREMKMQPSLERALRHKEILKA
jgi:predicted amidophosphoribosyltransferase